MEYEEKEFEYEDEEPQNFEYAEEEQFEESEEIAEAEDEDEPLPEGLEEELREEGDDDDFEPIPEIKSEGTKNIKFTVRGAAQPLLLIIRNSTIDILKFIHLQNKYFIYLNKKSNDPVFQKKFNPQKELQTYLNSFKKYDLKKLAAKILELPEGDERLKLVLKMNSINPLIIKKMMLNKQITELEVKLDILKKTKDADPKSIESIKSEKNKLIEKYDNILPLLSNVVVNEKLRYKMIESKGKKAIVKSDEMKKYEKFIKETKDDVDLIKNIVNDEETYEVFYDQDVMITRQTTDIKEVPKMLSNFFGNVHFSVIFIQNEEETKRIFKFQITVDLPRIPTAESKDPKTPKLTVTNKNSIYDKMVELRIAIRDANSDEDRRNAVNMYNEFLSSFRMKKTYAKFEHIMKNFDIFENPLPNYTKNKNVRGQTYVMFTTGNKTKKLEKSILKRIVPMMNIAGIFDLPTRRIEMKQSLRDFIEEKRELDEEEQKIRKEFLEKRKKKETKLIESARKDAKKKGLPFGNKEIHDIKMNLKNFGVPFNIADIRKRGKGIKIKPEDFDVNNILMDKISNHPLIKDVVKIKLENAIKFKAEKKKTMEIFGSYAKLFDQMTEENAIVDNSVQERYYTATSQNYKLNQSKINEVNKFFNVDVKAAKSNDLIRELYKLINNETLELIKGGKASTNLRKIIKEHLIDSNKIDKKLIDFANMIGYGKTNEEIYDILKKKHSKSGSLLNSMNKSKKTLNEFEKFIITDLDDETIEMRISLMNENLNNIIDSRKKRDVYDIVFDKYLDNVEEKENSKWKDFLKNFHEKGLYISNCENISDTEFANYAYNYLMYKFSFITGNSLCEKLKIAKTSLTEAEQNLIGFENDDDIKNYFKQNSPKRLFFDELKSSFPKVENIQSMSLSTYKKNKEAEKFYVIKEELENDVKEKREAIERIIDEARKQLFNRFNLFNKIKKKYNLSSTDSITDMINKIKDKRIKHTSSINPSYSVQNIENFIYEQSQMLRMTDDQIGFLKFQLDMEEESKRQVVAIKETISRKFLLKEGSMNEKDLEQRAQKAQFLKLEEEWSEHKKNFDNVYRKYMSGLTDIKKEEIDNLIFRIQQSKTLGKVVRVKTTEGRNVTLAPVEEKEMGLLKLLTKKESDEPLEYYFDVKYNIEGFEGDLDTYLGRLISDYINNGKYKQFLTFKFLKKPVVGETRIKRKNRKQILKGLKLKWDNDDLKGIAKKKYIKTFFKFSKKFNKKSKKENPKTEFIIDDELDTKNELSNKKNELEKVNKKISSDKLKIQSMKKMLRTYFDKDYWPKFMRGDQFNKYRKQYSVNNQQLKEIFWNNELKDINDGYMTLEFFDKIFWPRIIEKDDFQEFVNMVFNNDYMYYLSLGNSKEKADHLAKENLKFGDSYLKQNYLEYYEGFVMNEYYNFKKFNQLPNYYDEINKFNELVKQNQVTVEKLHKEIDELSKNVKQPKPVKQQMSKRDVVLSFIFKSPKLLANEIVSDKYRKYAVLSNVAEKNGIYEKCAKFMEDFRLDSVKNLFISKLIMEKSSNSSKNMDKIIKDILKSLDKYDTVFSYLCKFFKLFVVVDNNSPLTGYSDIYVNLLNNIVTGKQVIENMTIYDYFEKGYDLRPHTDKFTQPILENMIDLIYQYISLLSPFVRIKFNFVTTYPTISKKKE